MLSFQQAVLLCITILALLILIITYIRHFKTIRTARHSGEHVRGLLDWSQAGATTCAGLSATCLMTFTASCLSISPRQQAWTELLTHSARVLLLVTETAYTTLITIPTRSSWSLTGAVCLFGMDLVLSIINHGRNESDGALDLASKNLNLGVSSTICALNVYMLYTPVFGKCGRASGCNRKTITLYVLFVVPLVELFGFLVVLILTRIGRVQEHHVLIIFLITSVLTLRFIVRIDLFYRDKKVQLLRQMPSAEHSYISTLETVYSSPTKSVLDDDPSWQVLETWRLNYSTYGTAKSEGGGYCVEIDSVQVHEQHTINIDMAALDFPVPTLNMPPGQPYGYSSIEMPVAMQKQSISATPRPDQSSLTDKIRSRTTTLASYCG
ncbi:hypothetical protein EK21DRAFT_94597 [Setomelanomma holmii]|uniref:Uncharacterized protein n=1 Tax=Setomelanomma holmii TaxID=210430 RepID=A0A9P4GXJ6_9PLEO|nr:hypothetical protein EK21DRAFT_94597 [Setomelanomma holmii]